MLNSTDIDRLRSDVAANCRVFLALCKKAGYDVILTGTVRDNEYQMWCFNNGYSTARTPSFHSAKAGLAFDICKKGKTQSECYDDMTFWRVVGAIGKLMGFTWGGDWTKFTDMPHFQWDAHGQYSGNMVRNGYYPAAMPLYVMEDELDMTIDEAREELTTISGTGSAHDSWAADAVRTLTEAGIFSGDGAGNYGWGQCVTREAMAVVLYSVLGKLDLLDKLK